MFFGEKRKPAVQFTVDKLQFDGGYRFVKHSWYNMNIYARN